VLLPAFEEMENGPGIGIDLSLHPFPLTGEADGDIVQPCCMLCNRHSWPSQDFYKQALTCAVPKGELEVAGTNLLALSNLGSHEGEDKGVRKDQKRLVGSSKRGGNTGLYLGILFLGLRDVHYKVWGKHIVD
jgi:hypothetical protein